MAETSDVGITSVALGVCCNNLVPLVVLVLLGCTKAWLCATCILPIVGGDQSSQCNRVIVVCVTVIVVYVSDVQAAHNAHCNNILVKLASCSDYYLRGPMFACSQQAGCRSAACGSKLMRELLWVESPTSWRCLVFKNKILLLPCAHTL